MTARKKRLSARSKARHGKLGGATYKTAADRRDEPFARRMPDVTISDLVNGLSASTVTHAPDPLVTMREERDAARANLYNVQAERDSLRRQLDRATRALVDAVLA